MAETELNNKIEELEHIAIFGFDGKYINFGNEYFDEFRSYTLCSSHA